MNEQQRIYLAVLACVGIFFGWSYFFPPPVSPPSPPVAEAPASDSAPVAAGAAGSPAPQGAGNGAARAGDVGAPADASAPAAEVPLEQHTFHTALLDGALRNRDGALTKLDLLHYDERTQEGADPAPVSLVPPADVGQAQARVEWDLGGQPLPALNFADGEGLHLTGQNVQGAAVSLQVTPRADAYALDYTLRVDNRGQATVPAAATVVLTLAPPFKEEKHFLAPPTDQLHAVCAVGDGLERHDPKSVAKGPWTSEPKATWAALDRQYFVAAVLPAADAGDGRCTVRGVSEALSLRYAFAPGDVAPGGHWEKKFSVYFGPKRDDRMAAVSAHLPEVIDYNIWGIPLGFLARPMVALLNFFHGLTSSWGLAIMLLTLVVKSLLFPVTYKSSMSMRKMSLLKPELDRIKSQFENDRERQQMEQLKLFREKGVNPLGGCLPMLMQMPVWFALYRTLWSAVDLYQQPFLWLTDLTAKEPFPFMALALGGLTVLQQKLTPMAADNQQAKTMMFVMPVMLTMFMIALPSGLVLYILVNTILTILQQLAINKRAVAV